MFNKRLFMAQTILAGVKMEDLARELGVAPSTLYRKINNDGSFTRKEINQMISILGIENPSDVFFADELAETQE